MGDTYLSESSVLQGLNPDILPELTSSDFESTAPCVIRRKTNPTGDGTDFENMVISGKFKTNDDRNDPSTFFITAYREGPEDGESIDHFNNGYGIAIMPLSAQSAIDNRLNIFVVDNSLAVPTVVLENVVHTGWGDMPYIKAVNTTLDPGTTYNFELRFGQDGTFEFYMAPDGSLLSLIISQGAYQHQSDGTYYGVSCGYTEGYVWQVDNLGLSYVTGKYPVHEYLLSADDFSESFAIKCYGNASGYNGGPTAEYGVKMYVLDYLTSLWHLVDSHTQAPGDGNFLLSGADLSVSQYSSPEDGFIRVVVIGDFPSSYLNNLDAFLNVDQIYAENWNDQYAHVGGMGDVYIQETALPNEYVIDLYNVDKEEWLMATNTKILGDFHLPMAWITLVNTIDAAGNVTGTLVLGTDYTIYIDDEYRTYSADERKKIILVGGGGINIRITYLTFDNVELVNTYIISELRRMVCADLLAFVKIPMELYVTLDYRGSASRTALQSALSNWAMGESEDTVDYDKIKTLLEALDDVTSVDVELLSVVKHAQNGNPSTVTGTSLTLDDSEYEQWIMFNDNTHIAFSPNSD